MRHFWMICGLSLALGANEATNQAKANPTVKDGSRIIETDRSGTVRLMVRRSGHAQIMDVRNDMDVPISVVLGITRAVNVAGIGRAPIQRSVPPHSQVRLVSLHKRDARFPISYRHSFSYAVDYSPEPGKSGPVAGPVYELPWVGGPFQLSQGAGGDFSHSNPRSRYAVDIAMPEGTPIVAARGGTVLEVRNNQSGRQPSPAGNQVRIRHDDGTHGAYLHLQRGSVRVAPGDRVATGTLLAKSGNTGRSTGPHLHFVVQQETDGTMLSIPFRFRRPVDALPNVANN